MARSLGIGGKLLLASLPLTALVGAVITWQTTDRMQQAILAELDSKGRALGESLARSAEDTMLNRDSSTIQAFIDNYRSISGVAYVYVVDEESRVVAHTFVPQVPPGDFVRANLVPEGSRNSIREVVVPVIHEGEASRRALDIAFPILAGAMGTAHIGMDLDQAYAVASSLRRRAMATVALTLLLGAVVLSTLVERVVRPIRLLTRVSARIVSEGDLTGEVTATSSDEVGELARTFGQMVRKLREVLGLLREATAELERGVITLDASAIEQEKQFELQARSLQETHVTAQEIKQTSLVAAQRAEAVLRVVDRADEVGRAGEQALDDSLAGLTEIRSQSEETLRRISKLGENARQIAGITGTVKDLADQSNMLALNAAIEAVRSGEHGKGFGVVAREIRSLADQSIQATKRVREILDEIAGAISGAVAITETGTRRVETGVGQVKASSESLRQLSAIAKEVSGAVRQIASAVGQQNAGVTQIFAAVTEQTRLGNETRERIGQTTEAAASLKAVSGKLREAVGRYRV